MTAIVIAVTGAVGAGKSTFSKMLAELGGRLVSADVIAAEVFKKPEVKQLVVEAFGEGILNSEGAIDHNSLGSLAFGDAESLRKLTDIVFPFIGKELTVLINRMCEESETPVILEAPTLFEARCESLAKHVITVEAPPELCTERVEAERNWDAGEVARREGYLVGEEIRRRRAGHVIENKEDLKTLRQAAEEIWRRLTASK